jgi:Zn-dependent protease with chaperone function
MMIALTTTALTTTALTTTAAAVLNPIPLHAIAQTSAIQIVAVQIVNCLVEGTLIAILAGAVLKVARLQNSSVKFAVWFSALIGIAALPAVIGISSGSWAHRSWAHSTTAAQAASRAAITLPGSWALYIFVAWAAIAAWSLLGVARSLWHLRVLRRGCVPVDPARLDVLLQNTLARLGLSQSGLSQSGLSQSGSSQGGSSENASQRPVELCISNLVQVPTAIGLVKPAVILPSWILQELSPQELNQILLHELAHLRRRDDWTNLAQKLVKALFFFHPAVWWIERKISLEREMACDDAVVAETASPRAYAECLAHLAEKTLLQRSLAQQSLAQQSLAQRSVALAQEALGRIRQTSLRVAQILDGHRPARAGRTWKPAVSFVALFAIGIVAWISRAPRLIAFQDRDATAVVNPIVARVSPAGNAGAPIIPASGLRESKLIAAPLVHVVPASFKVPATHRGFESSNRSIAMHSRGPNPIAPGVGQTSAHHTDLVQTYLVPTDVRSPNATVTPVAFTETFFVVIEDGSSDRPVLQIQWWRVMVLHPAVEPDSNRIPPKKT